MKLELKTWVSALSLSLGLDPRNCAGSLEFEPRATALSLNLELGP